METPWCGVCKEWLGSISHCDGCSMRRDGRIWLSSHELEERWKDRIDDQPLVNPGFKNGCFRGEFGETKRVLNMRSRMMDSVWQRYTYRWSSIFGLTWGRQSIWIGAELGPRDKPDFAPLLWAYRYGPLIAKAVDRANQSVKGLWSFPNLSITAKQEGYWGTEAGAPPLSTRGYSVPQVGFVISMCLYQADKSFLDRVERGSELFVSAVEDILYAHVVRGLCGRMFSAAYGNSTWIKKQLQGIGDDELINSATGRILEVGLGRTAKTGSTQGDADAWLERWALYFKKPEEQRRLYPDLYETMSVLCLKPTRPAPQPNTDDYPVVPRSSTQQSEEERPELTSLPIEPPEPSILSMIAGRRFDVKESPGEATVSFGGRIDASGMVFDSRGTPVLSIRPDGTVQTVGGTGVGTIDREGSAFVIRNAQNEERWRLESNGLVYTHLHT